MLMTFLPLFVSKLALAAYIQHSPRSTCTPSQISFTDSTLSESNTPYVAISPPGSYAVTTSGLELYLDRPDGVVTTKHGVNDKVADGATVNSTNMLLYGKVTFEVSAPTVPGVVTAAILIAPERDEIDVELLGGDPIHWQTNVFAPSPQDNKTLYGVFGSTESVSSIADFHKYTVDWNEERIIWSVDDVVVRTLESQQAKKNGVMHYPSHPCLIQLGIWDASTPIGTAKWAYGPIDWTQAPQRMTAVVRSVTVEC